MVVTLCYLVSWNTMPRTQGILREERRRQLGEKLLTTPRQVAGVPLSRIGTLRCSVPHIP